MTLIHKKHALKALRGVAQVEAALLDDAARVLGRGSADAALCEAARAWTASGASTCRQGR